MERLQEKTQGKIRSGAPKSSLISKSGSSQLGKKPPTDETCVVSTCGWVLTNCVSGRMLQPSTEPVITNVCANGFLSWKAKLVVWGLRIHFSLLTFSAHGVVLSCDRSDIVKEYILCTLFLLFLHCFWFRGNHRRPCAIISLYHGAPCLQK